MLPSAEHAPLESSLLEPGQQGRCGLMSGPTQSKEEEKEGQPSPLSGKIPRGYSTFQCILLGQAPETDRCVSRFAPTPKKERPGHAGLGPPQGAWERANPPEKLVSDAARSSSSDHDVSAFGSCPGSLRVVTPSRHHTRKHPISTEERKAKLGIHDIRHYVHSRVLRYLGHVFRTEADRTPSLLQRCWVVSRWQAAFTAAGKTKVLYDSAVQNLLEARGGAQPP